MRLLISGLQVRFLPGAPTYFGVYYVEYRPNTYA
jgi:hypothetical protein